MEINRDLLFQRLEEIFYASRQATIARELTHSLYRYPASMSPQLARSLIHVFTKPGDIILDPFCGGGTTAIEALAYGRKAFCSDLNNLACFVTRSKASPLSDREIANLRKWIDDIAIKTLQSGIETPIPLVTSRGKKYVPHTHALLLQLKDSTEYITGKKLKQLARLIVLRTGQVCLDCREKQLNPVILKSTFLRIAGETIEKIKIYSKQCKEQRVNNGSEKRLRVFCSDAEKVARILGDQIRSVQFVLTSPPYPGVHVLYHRWQFRGRKEISLPYFLAGLNNGACESHYTLGSRKERSQKHYFSRIRRIYEKLNTSLEPGTVVAQVVAFPVPDQQLQQYLLEMEKAGLENLIFAHRNHLIYRNIPNRKWYVRTGTVQSKMGEYVLIHRATGDKKLRSIKTAEGD